MSAPRSPSGIGVVTDYTDSGDRSDSLGAMRLLSLFATVIRFGVAFALIGVGGNIIYYIFLEVYNAYLHIDQNVFVTTIIAWLQNEALLFDPAGESFVLGKASATIIALFFGLLLISFAISAGLKFFTTGIRILTMRS